MAKQKINSFQNGGFWEELSRTTLGSAGNTISLSSVPARKYLKIIMHLIATGGTIGGTFQYNGDTAANYAHRYSENGTADASAGSAASHYFDPTSAAAVSILAEFDVVNRLASEKLTYGYASSTGAAGGANIGSRREWFFKWANTSAQITSLTVTNTGTGNFAIGSEVLILGHD